MSDMKIERPGLPDHYSGDRAAVSVIYYLLNNGAESKWHKVKSPEIWLWHAGGTLELKLGGHAERPTDEEGAPDVSSVRLGHGIGFQGVVPPNVWQSAKILDGDFVIVSCIVAPSFHWDDFSWPPATGHH